MKHLLTSSGLILAMMTTPGWADGFHYQITNTAHLIADAQGRLSALELNWEYDPEVSAALMEGEDLSPAGRDAALQGRADDIMADLLDLGYFTNLSLEGGSRLNVLPAEQYKLDMKANGQLALDFVLPLETPLDVKGQVLNLEVSDPDGVGAVTYPAAGQVRLDDALAASCAPPAIEKQQLSLPGDHKLTVETVVLQCS